MSFLPLETIFKDDSAKSLLFANLATIALALVFDWSVLTLMWVYLLQSIIIGVFAFFKILFAPAPFAAITQNHTAKAIITIGKFFLALFFAFHYGIFHAAYVIFLLAFSAVQDTGVDVQGIFLASLIFLLNHAYSSWRNRFEMPSIGQPFFEPYIRILPMHLTIIFGGFFLFSGIAQGNRIVLIIFLLLKTITDLRGHGYKHRTMEKTA